MADIQKDLLLLEEQEGSVNFKFGVVYMRPGQTCDDEMLSNGKFSLLIKSTYKKKHVLTMKKNLNENYYYYFFVTFSFVILWLLLFFFYE